MFRKVSDGFFSHNVQATCLCIEVCAKCRKKEDTVAPFQKGQKGQPERIENTESIWSNHRSCRRNEQGDDDLHFDLDDTKTDNILKVSLKTRNSERLVTLEALKKYCEILMIKEITKTCRKQAKLTDGQYKLYMILE